MRRAVVRAVVCESIPFVAAALLAGACGGGAGGAAAAPAPAAVVAAVPKRPAEVTPAAIALGDSIFNAASCQRCHGKGGLGGQNGPSLTTGKWEHGSGSFEDIVRTITNGVAKEEVKDPTRRFAMRARGGVQPLLTDDQVKALAAYVWSLSHK